MFLFLRHGHVCSREIFNGCLMELWILISGGPKWWILKTPAYYKNIRMFCWMGGREERFFFFFWTVTLLGDVIVRWREMRKNSKEPVVINSPFLFYDVLQFHGSGSPAWNIFNRDVTAWYFVWHSTFSHFQGRPKKNKIKTTASTWWRHFWKKKKPTTIFIREFTHTTTCTHENNRRRMVK